MMTKKNGILICFTGIDGSGKTTQSRRLVDWCLSENISAVYLWNRGEAMLRNLVIALGRKIIGTSESTFNGDQVSHRIYQSRKSRLFNYSIIRFIWSGLVRAEHVWQIRARVSPLLKEGKVIISDRYIWDSTIDLAASFAANNDWVVNHANQSTWARVPQADLKFFLDIPGNVALQRKNDIPVPEYIFQRIGLYQHMANHQHMVCLDGCADVNFLHNQIVQTVAPLLLLRK